MLKKKLLASLSPFDIKEKFDTTTGTTLKPKFKIHINILEKEYKEKWRKGLTKGSPQAQ